MTHTAGPWEYEAETGEIIAPRAKRMFGRACVIAWLQRQYDGEEHANGLVMAAAPALLEALQAILPWHDAHPIEATDNPVINKCRAAIKAATTGSTKL